MEPKHPAHSQTVLARWMGISDANRNLNVHGGVIMTLCDEAASLAAVRHCSSRIVTAGVDRLTFLTPVALGELVSFRAKLTAAWRTSMEVAVSVEAEKPETGQVRTTTHAYLTIVAVDDAGRPIPVPPLEPQTDEERRAQQEAELRRANRLAEREEIERLAVGS